MDAVNFSGSYVHIFSPSMTGQFQFGRSVSDIPTFREFEGIDGASVAEQTGFPSGIYQYRDGPVLSGIGAANYFGGTPAIVTNRPANNYQIKGDISLVKGKHTFRFGGGFHVRDNVAHPSFSRRHVHGSDHRRLRKFGDNGRLRRLDAAELRGGLVPAQHC